MTGLIGIPYAETRRRLLRRSYFKIWFHDTFGGARLAAGGMTCRLAIPLGVLLEQSTAPELGEEPHTVGRMGDGYFPVALVAWGVWLKLV